MIWEVVDIPFQCIECAEAGYYTELTANEWLHHECKELRALYWLSEAQRP